MHILAHTPRRAAPRVGAAALGGLILSCLSLLAQPLTGGPFVVFGAQASGGTAQGDNYRLDGWIAWAGANTVSGGDFSCTASRLTAPVAPGPEVRLNVQWTPEGQARIWWPAELQGYLLESTPTVGPGSQWQPVEPAPAANEMRVNPDQKARYFRLRRL